MIERSPEWQAKVNGLRQQIADHGEARFKHGAKVKIDHGKLQVTRRSRVVRRFAIDAYAAAYAYAMRPTSPRGPAPRKPQPPARDWGPCPF